MKIIEKDDKVIIDDMQFYGHVDRNQSCNECKLHLVYHEKFDAYFCPQCNSWTEKSCSDSNCKYCSNRPEKPLP